MLSGELPPSAPLSTSAAVVGIRLKPAARDRAAVWRAIPPVATSKANSPAAETPAAAVKLGFSHGSSKRVPGLRALWRSRSF